MIPSIYTNVNGQRFTVSFLRHRQAVSRSQVDEKFLRVIIIWVLVFDVSRYEVVGVHIFQLAWSLAKCGRSDHHGLERISH